MKVHRVFVLLALAPFCFANFCFAKEIKELSYEFKLDSDIVKYERKEMFVICSECPAETVLTKKPQPPTLAIRVVEPEEPIKEVKEETKEKQELKLTVHFDFDSYKLKPQAKEILLSHLDELKRAQKIEIYGYTCDIGTKQYNLKLSQKRAEAVAEFLKTHGVKVDHVEGKGECCFVSKDRRLNRRAEVIAK